MIANRRRESGRSMEPVIAVAVLALVVGALVVNRGAIIPAVKTIGAAIGIYVGAVLLFALVGVGLFAIGKRRMGYEILFVLDTHRRGVENDRTRAIAKKWRYRRDSDAIEPHLRAILDGLAYPGPHSASLFDLAVECEHSATPANARLHVALPSILPHLDAASLQLALIPAAHDDDAVRRDANLRTILTRLPENQRASSLAMLLDWGPVESGKPAGEDDELWLQRYATTVAPWKSELAQARPRRLGRLTKLLARLG